MTGTLWDRLAPWVGAACIAVALCFAWLSWRPDGRTDPEILPPRVDSAVVAEREAAARIEAEARVRQHIIDSVEAEQARRDREDAARRRSIATLTAHADTLAALARARGDTLSAAWAAAQAYRQANDTLHRALAAADSAREAAEIRARLYHAAHDTVDAQRRRVLALNAELREAVDRAAARGRCRVVGVVPCPSRTTVAVVGIVAGYTAAEYLNRD